MNTCEQVQKLQGYIQQLAATPGGHQGQGGAGARSKAGAAALEQLRTTDVQLAGVEAALLAALQEEGRMREEIQEERGWVEHHVLCSIIWAIDRAQLVLPASCIEGVEGYRRSCG